MNNDVYSEEPWHRIWPKGDLESVKVCPVCSCGERSLLHTDLVDNTFRSAPGKWLLWQCNHCRIAYLDPRPKLDAIHLAYSSYYTHRQPNEKDDYALLSPLRKLRRSLINGYTKWRYGTQATPASTLGLPAVFFLPNVKRILDREYRHLPKLPINGGSLLDVGCGDGSFLLLARTCGWQVVGLDPDQKAVVNAKSQDLIIHQGGIELFEGKSSLFDVITLNHVIEHVHDPARVLRTCHTLLKPGGQLWVETPNIDSFGHAHFQKNWRGLEAPRHLVLFNRKALIDLLTSVGFRRPLDQARPSSCVGMYEASYAIEMGCSLCQKINLPKKTYAHAKYAQFCGTFLRSKREFLLIVAKKYPHV